MPAAVAIVSYAAGAAASAAAVSAGWVAANGVGAALVSGITSMAVGRILGGSSSAGAQPSGVTSAGAADTPAATAERGLVVNTSSTVDPIPVVYGERRIGGTRLLMQTSGSSNANLHVVLAHCEGEVDSIQGLYFDGVPATDARFSGRYNAHHYLGTDDQAASSQLIEAVPSVWTSAHKVSGVAYSYIKLVYNASTWSAVPEIAVTIRGRKVYDPRNGLTVWSANPALCLRDYLINTRFGRGIDAADIDDDSIVAAANYCDVQVSVPDGNGGTTTQQRYTCNAILDTSRPAIDNVRALLGCMRGMLVFSGGVYKLVLDKAEAAAFTFDEDNIVGAWNIKLGDKRGRTNRIRATWMNPDQSWQPDIALVDSAAFRAIDNGLLLESQMDLSCTTNPYEAQMLAQRHMKQSRFGTLVSFRATVAGLLCEVGDVVAITHSTPGWVAKDFRIVRMSLLSSDEVEVVAVEYEDSVYDVDPLTAPRTSQTTTIPDPYTVAAPGVPDVVEALYETTGSAGVKNRVTVSWTASTDMFVVDYLPEYRIDGGAWNALPAVIAPGFELTDAAPGTYEVRVRARNMLAVLSDYSPTRTKEVLGLTAAPANPSGFTLVAMGGVYYAEWTLSSDLDVRIGGRAVIRHSTKTSGATWADGVIVAEFNGDAISGLVPMMAGTYLLKFKDSTDNWSVTEASFVPSEALLTGYTTVATSTQHTAFAGSKTNLVASGGELSLMGTANIDAMTDNIDDWPAIDWIGGVSLTGSYDFDATMDLTTVASRRFEATITAECFDIGDLIDSRTANIDDWSDFDGAVVNDADATLYIRTTSDDPAGSPTWSGWVPFFVAEFNCRAAQFRLDLETADPSHNIKVSALSVRARIPA